MTSIKVLHIYKTSAPLTYGGVETVIKTLIEKLNNQNITSDVACVGNHTAEINYKHSKINVFKKTFELASCPFSCDMFFKLPKLVKNYDVIHFHYPWPFADLLSILFCREKRQITTYHSDIIKQKLLKLFYRFFEKLFLSKQKAIVYTSPQYKKTSSNLKCYESKTHLIPIGIETPEQISKPDISIPKEYFIFVGVLRYYKGLHLLLQAMSMNNFNLLIVGSGPCKNQLKSLSQKLKLSNRVFFVGGRSDAEKNYLIKNSISMVLPSHLRSEAYGISLVEGLAMGKPLISCKIGTGTEYINKHGITGLCVAPDPMSIDQAMQKIMRPSMKEKFSRNAHLRFKKFFSADTMASKYLHLYNSL
ncbi:MAG: glycosyltransferase [Rickettsiales bacterium]